MPPPAQAEYDWPPPPPRELLAKRALYEANSSKGVYLQFRRGSSDNPLDTLYRLYVSVVPNRRFDLRNEIECFWNHPSWAVASIPNPRDPDPERYAILACIFSLLVEAFNENIGRGSPRDAPSILSWHELEELGRREKKFETVPSWTIDAPALAETLRISHKNDDTLKKMDDARASSAFGKENILLWHPHILSIETWDNLVSLSKDDEGESGPDAEVTKEDQDKINCFSRLHSKEKLVEEELQGKQKDKEDLEELSTELELADEDEPILYKVGDSFVSLPISQAQTMLSTSTEQIDDDISRLEESLQELRDEMKGLKAQLYARFGKSINLD